MFARPFRPERFLRSVYGTEPFLDYCRRRNITFLQVPDCPMQADDLWQWTAALLRLPQQQQLHVEVELAKVNELADPESTDHLLAAVAGHALPPEQIPGGAPLALWFLLHHPGTFHEVLLSAEIREHDSWRGARAPPGLTIPDMRQKTTDLGSRLKEFFRLSEGSGRFCTVDAHRLPDAWCFFAYIADRLQLLDGFTDEGQHTLHRLLPAVQLAFVYYPDGGAVLLKSRLRGEQRILELIRHFETSVLGVELSEDCLEETFNLDQLKHGFQPLPDAEDMESVRIKALHLRYPQRFGKRHLKLETLTADGMTAIPELLRAHFSGEGMLDQLEVSYAELLIRLRVAGKSRSHIIRLWPNCCNLSPTPLGDRLRSCLKTWGLLHVRPS